MIFFHGGCDGCTQQQKNGVNFCYDCCYFEADLARLAVKARRMKDSLDN